MAKVISDAQFHPYYNPLTQGARQTDTIRAGESIPDGWGITGFTYQTDTDGKHAGTLIRIRPEVQKRSLEEKAIEAHKGWSESTPSLSEQGFFDRREVR